MVTAILKHPSTHLHWNHTAKLGNDDCLLTAVASPAGLQTVPGPLLWNQLHISLISKQQRHSLQQRRELSPSEKRTSAISPGPQNGVNCLPVSYPRRPDYGARAQTLSENEDTMGSEEKAELPKPQRCVWGQAAQDRDRRTGRCFFLVSPMVLTLPARFR